MPVPAVSIIIPVYNRAHVVADSIASVLAQSFRDFELIVVDDGSTDRSLAVVESFDDPRIRLVRHERNQGETPARNTGIGHARGRYIAWLDSDDIARPDRLARQVAYLEDHPGIALLGSWAGKIDLEGRRLKGIRTPPTDPDVIRAWLVFRSAFQHSSIIGRAEVIAAHPYRAENVVCQDVDVFLRVSEGHAVANLPHILIDRRLHPGQAVRQYQAKIRERNMALQRPLIERIGLDFSEEYLARHVYLGRPKLDGMAVDRDFLTWAEDWLIRLAASNGRTRYIEPDALDLACGFFWSRTCRAARRTLGKGQAAAAFARSPLSRKLLSPVAVGWIGRIALRAVGG